MRAVGEEDGAGANERFARLGSDNAAASKRAGFLRDFFLLWLPGWEPSWKKTAPTDDVQQMPGYQASTESPLICFLK